MKKCFDVLGVGENATTEQIQDAYDRKASRYSNDLYLEDPKYAKKKLKELKQAYKEACSLAKKDDGEDAFWGEILEDFEEKPTVDIDENPEEYMKQLYHKHLGRNVNRVSGAQRDQRHRHIINKKGRSKANKITVAVVVTAAIAFFVSVGVIFGDFSTLNEYDFKNIDEYRPFQVADADREIADKAYDIYRFYQEQMESGTGIVHHDGIVTENRPLDDKAAQLAKLYWGRDTIEEVSDYLAGNYAGYPTDSGDTILRQLDSIMLFYGFPTYDETLYEVNPFSGAEIWYYSDHIDFLMDAYNKI